MKGRVHDAEMTLIEVYGRELIDSSKSTRNFALMGWYFFE